jgi:hypothetical protein
MNEKTKQIVGGIVGATVVSVIGVFGYWHYKKIKEQQELERLMETGEADIAENYQDDRPIFKKLKDKLFPQDYRNLPRTQRDIEKDLEEYEKQHKLRSRFYVFSNNGRVVSDRFKVSETLGDKGVAVRGTGRFRTSGNLYRNTPSGYGGNKRNANFSDLDIPNNYKERKPLDIW